MQKQQQEIKSIKIKAICIIVKTKNTSFQNEKYKKSLFHKKDGRDVTCRLFLYEFPVLRDEVQ